MQIERASARQGYANGYLVEIDEKWTSDTKAYIKWEYQDA